MKRWVAQGAERLCDRARGVRWDLPALATERARFERLADRGAGGGVGAERGASYGKSRKR